MVDFRDMSDEELEELYEAIKSNRAERRQIGKEREKEQRLARIETAKEEIKENSRVKFLYKEKEYTGVVSKLNPKTFSVIFDYDGETITVPRAYHLFLEMA